MGLVSTVDIKPLSATRSSMAEFYTPQASDETMLVQVEPFAHDELFVHHFQTDQLLVVRGSFVLVVLQNRQYRYIPLSEQQPAVVRIPPNVPHGAINFSADPCVMVNAVLRHGPACERDYRPLKRPFPYDLDQARQVWQTHLQLPIPA